MSNEKKKTATFNVNVACSLHNRVMIATNMQ